MTLFDAGCADDARAAADVSMLIELKIPLMRLADDLSRCVNREAAGALSYRKD
jgi:hypothetical protein